MTKKQILNSISFFKGGQKSVANKINLPRNVASIINKLEADGYEAYIVGGCVRDSLLGLEPHDWDICTSALPEQVLETFREYKVLLTGLQHGTITVMIDNNLYEITSFRVENEYSDNRHPAKVKFVSKLKLDLMRRDFTINAMAYNDRSGLIDLYGGTKDLHNKIIRCVGDPDERFTEDALRMLRAIRFAVRFNYTINEKTMASLLRHKDLLKNISKERICSELTQMFSYTNTIDLASPIKTLVELLKPIVPELHLIDPYEICRRLIRSRPTFEIRLATLFDFQDIETILKRLRFSNKIISNVSSIRNYGHKIYDERLTWSHNEYKYYSRKLLHYLGYKNARLAIEYAILLSKNEDEKLLMMLLDYFVKASKYDGSVYTLSKLDINGNDLITLGYSGKQIGDILNYLLDMVMRGRILNRKQELAWLATKMELE